MDSNELKKLDDDQKRVISRAIQNGDKSVYDFLKSSINSITYEVGDESVTIDKTDNSISYTKQSTGQLTDKDILNDLQNPESILYQIMNNLGYEPEQIKALQIFEIIDILKQDVDDESLNMMKISQENYQPYKEWLNNC